MKEIIGRDLYVDGDVLPRADDFDGVEEYREQGPTADADILGFALRSAAIRHKRLQLAEATRETTTDDEEDLRTALEEREQSKSHPEMPSELQDLIEQVEEEIRQLHSYGAHEKEIDRKAGLIWYRGLARLRARNIDVSSAPDLLGDFQDATPVDDIPSAGVIHISQNQFDQQEAEIDHLVDTRGISYEEARIRLGIKK